MRRLPQSIIGAAVLVLSVHVPAAYADRLPLLAVPEHYQLQFTPDLQHERFAGRATIRMRVLAPTRNLVLHAAGLDITHARIRSAATTDSLDRLPQAAWMEAKAISAWHLEWAVDLNERQAIQGAMAVDALQATRPIRGRAQTPDEINELFDPIAYEKAAAVLTMIETFVGEEPFRRGINAYLDQHQYRNADAEDFSSVMTRATGKPVDRSFAASSSNRASRS
jgi:aminopeptidase N